MGPSQLLKQKAVHSDVGNRSVFLMIPNLIGYLRAILAIGSVLVAYSNWFMLLVFYTTSQILDAVDGWAARKYRQETKFGGVLDQLIDRLSTVFLYVLNCQMYPKFTSAIILALATDLGGHWLHTFGAALTGSSSHKLIPGNRTMLQFYYEKKPVMLVCIIGYEGFWLSLFILSQISSLDVYYTLAYFLLLCSIPFALFKAYTNVYQGVHGALVLASLDQKTKVNNFS